MGLTRLSWRTTASAIFAMLQIQALNGVITEAQTAVEGQDFYFRCNYNYSQGFNTKYFSYNGSSSPVISTKIQNQWVNFGRFFLYDNTSGGFFMIKMSNLKLEDNGRHWCGLSVSFNATKLNEIELKVTRGPSVTMDPPDHSTHNDIVAQKDRKENLCHHLLYMTTVLYMAAITTVCLFTLMLAARQQQPAPDPNIEVMSEYVIMMPNVNNRPEFSFMEAGRAELSASWPEPPDLSSCPSVKRPESSVTLSNTEYADISMLSPICLYQHLDLSQMEEHVYDNLHVSSRPVEVREQSKC